MLKILSSTFSEVLRPESLTSYGSNAKISPNGKTLVVIDMEKSIVYFYDKHRDGLFYLTTQLFNYYLKNQNSIGNSIAFNSTNNICAISTDASNFIDYEATINETLFTSSCVLYFKSGDNQIPKTLPNGDVIYEDTFMWQQLVYTNNHPNEYIADMCFMENTSNKYLYQCSVVSIDTSQNINLYQYDLSGVYYAIDSRQTEDLTIVNHKTKSTTFNTNNIISVLRMSDISNNNFGIFTTYKQTPSIINYDIVGNMTLSFNTKSMNENIIDLCIFNKSNLLVLTPTKIFSIQIANFAVGIPEVIWQNMDGEVYSRIFGSNDIIVISSNLNNKIKILRKTGNLWQEEKILEGDNSFGFNVSISEIGDQIILTEPYKSRCFRYFYETLSDDWLKQKLQTDGFSNNFMVDQSENTIIITNANERTLDIYENIPKQLSFLSSNKDSIIHRMFNYFNVTKYWLNETGNRFHFTFTTDLVLPSTITNYLVTIPCSNNDEFSNSQNNFFIQGIRSEFVDTNQKGDIIYTKNSIYKKFPNYNDANDLNFFICNGDLPNTQSTIIKLNGNGNIIYSKYNNLNYIYKYDDEMKFSLLNTKDSFTKYYKSSISTLSTFNLLDRIGNLPVGILFGSQYYAELNAYMLTNSPKIILLNNLSSSSSFIRFDDNNSIYFMDASFNKILKLNEKENYQYVHEISIPTLSSYNSADFQFDSNIYSFKETINSQPRIFYLSSNNLMEEYLTNLNELNITSTTKLKFYEKNLFVYSDTSSVIQHYDIEVIDGLVGSEPQEKLTKRLKFTKINDIILGENCREIYITQRRDLVVVSVERLYSFPNLNLGEKQLVHFKRFYETKMDYDLNVINKQYYYNVNRMLGSKFLSNYNEKYKENNTYVVDQFECFFTQEFTKDQSLNGEYIINHNRPLFFRDDKINKYINSAKYKTYDQLMNYIETQNNRSKIYEVTTTNYLRGEAFILNGLPDIGRFFLIALGFLALFILIFGPFALGFGPLLATVVLAAFMIKEWTRFGEIKSSGAFVASVYDQSGNYLDQSRFFKYKNDEPCSLVIPADTPNDTRLGGDGWRFRKSVGNNPDFYYDPITKKYVKSSPYTELLTTEKINKINVVEEPDLLNDDVNQYPIIKDFYSPLSFRSSKMYFVKRIQIKVLKRLNYPEANFIDKSNAIYGKKMDMTPDGEHIVINSDINTLTNTQLKNNTANFYRTNLFTLTEAESFEDTPNGFHANGKTSIRNYTINVNSIRTLSGLVSDGVPLSDFPNLDGNFNNLNDVITAVNQVNTTENIIDVEYETYYATELNFKGGMGWVNWAEVYVNNSLRITTEATGVRDVNLNYSGINTGQMPKTKILSTPSTSLSKTFPSTINVMYVPRFTLGYILGDYPNVLDRIPLATILLSGYTLKVEVTLVLRLKFTETFVKKYYQKLLKFSSFYFYDKKNLDWVQSKSIIFNLSKEHTPRTFSDTDTFLKIENTSKTITSAELLNENPYEKVFLIRDGLVLGYKNKSLVCIDKNNIQPDKNVSFQTFNLKYVANQFEPILNISKFNDNIILNYQTQSNIAYYGMRNISVNNLDNIQFGTTNFNISFNPPPNTIYYNGIVYDGIDMLFFGKSLGIITPQDFLDTFNQSSFTNITSSNTVSLDLNTSRITANSWPVNNISVTMNQICYSPNKDFYVMPCSGGIVCTVAPYGDRYYLQESGPFQYWQNFSQVTLPDSRVFEAQQNKYVGADMNTCVFAANEFIIAGESRIFRLKYDERLSQNWVRENFDCQTNPLGTMTYEILSMATDQKRVVVVGKGGFIGYKIVGQNCWRRIELADVTEDLNCVIHDGNNFICVGDNGLIITSQDGITWIQSSVELLPFGSSNTSLKNRNYKKIIHFNEPNKKVNYIILSSIGSTTSGSDTLKHYTLYFINEIYTNNQNINKIIKSSKNINEFLIVQNNILSINKTDDEHFLLETNRYKIQDEIGKLVLDDHIYNCLPDKGLVRKYERLPTSSGITVGSQLYQDDGYLYFGANIATFGDYHIIDTDQGKIIMRHKSDPNIFGVIETSSTPVDFGTNIVTRDKIYVNDPNNNKLYIIKAVPYQNIS